MATEIFREEEEEQQDIIVLKIYRRVMAKLKLISVISFLFLISVFVVSAGKIFGQDKKNVNLMIGEIRNITLKYEDRGSVRYELQLKLQFKNLTDCPIIMLKKDFWLAGESISLTEPPQEKGRVIYSSSHLTSNSSSLPSVIQWRIEIDQAYPPKDKFEIINPQETFETDVSINLYVLKMDKQYAEVWEAIQNEKPLSLQIDVEMFPRGYNTKLSDGSSFVENLYNRWKSFGCFQYGMISSEPMPLTFSKASVS
jgi:hypothetical protein